MDDLIFHDYKTSYQYEVERSTHKLGKKRALEELGTVEQYYRHMTAMYPDNSNVVLLRLETAWHASNLPYYKVYPDYAEMFGDTDCNVQLKDLNMPYSVFAARFCRGKEPLLLGRPVGACLLSYGRAKGSAVTLGMVAYYSDEAKGRFRVWSTGPVDETKNCSMQDLVEMVRDSQEAVHDEQSECNVVDMSRLLRICVNTGMIATCAGEAEEDVMSKDIAEYVAAVNADRPKAAALAAKARNQRNGRPGFSFGRCEWLLGRATDEAGSAAGAVGVPLTYGYVRKGHYHHYWSGPGRTELIRKWTRPCRVRPGLPLNEAARPGEHTLDSVATQNQILNPGGTTQ